MLQGKQQQNLQRITFGECFVQNPFLSFCLVPTNIKLK